MNATAAHILLSTVNLNDEDDTREFTARIYGSNIDLTQLIYDAIRERPELRELFIGALFPSILMSEIHEQVSAPAAFDLSRN